MLELLTENVEVLNASLNAAMVIIWVVYLQIFLISHRRQSRSVIHIDLGVAKAAQSRVLVTNLSSAALYVQGIVAELGREGLKSRMLVTDRDEVEMDADDDPLRMTNRGTLQPGQTIDIGSLDDLIQRAHTRLNEEWTFDEIDAISIAVVAISGQAERIVGARKSFSVRHEGDDSWFSAQSVLTRQMRPLQTRDEFNRLFRDQKFQ